MLQLVQHAGCDPRIDDIVGLVADDREHPETPDRVGVNVAVQNIIQIFDRFPTQESCIARLEVARLRGGKPVCLYCGSVNTAPSEHRYREWQPLCMLGAQHESMLWCEKFR